MRDLFAALVVAACAPDDTAARDYSLTACPPPWGVETGDVFARRTVCDRGAGAAPRFVTLAACQAEVNPQPPRTIYQFDSTHPADSRCFATVSLVTIDDVRALVYTRGN